MYNTWVEITDEFPQFGTVGVALQSPLLPGSPCQGSLLVLLKLLQDHLEVPVVRHVEGGGAGLVLDGDVRLPGEEEVHGLHGGGEVHHGVVEGGVPEAVLGGEVRPGLHQQGHDVGELGGLGGGLGEESGPGCSQE